MKKEGLSEEGLSAGIADKRKDLLKEELMRRRPKYRKTDGREDRVQEGLMRVRGLGGRKG